MRPPWRSLGPPDGLRAGQCSARQNRAGRAALQRENSSSASPSTAPQRRANQCELLITIFCCTAIRFLAMHQRISLLLRSLLRDERLGVWASRAGEMDTAAFATWLGGIGLLHPAQRAEAFRELALAEADDPVEASAHPVDAAVPLDEAAVAPSLPLAKADDAAPEEDLLSKVGRDRIARFGCPHRGGDDVRPWGKAGGKPRYRCTSCRKTFNPLRRRR